MDTATEERIVAGLLEDADRDRAEVEAWDGRAAIKALRDALQMAVDFDVMDLADLDAKYGRAQVDDGWLGVALAALETN